MLPVNLSFIESKYEYQINLAECAYMVDPGKARLLSFLVDAVWWCPLIMCVISTSIFAGIMIVRSKRFKTLATKKYDAIKKTVILTLFFILSYLPLSIFSFLQFLTSKDIGLTWAAIERSIGYELYLYIRTVLIYIIPASRSVLTPIMLRLEQFIFFCSNRKGTAMQSQKDSISNIFKSRLNLGNVSKNSNNKVFTVASSSIGMNVIFKKATLKRTSSEKLV